MKKGSTKNNGKSSFRLSDEARAKIDFEYADVSEKYRRRMGVYDYGETEYEDEEEYEEDIPRKPGKHRLRKLAFRLILLCLLVLLVDLGILLFTGQLWFNEPRKRDYPIRGPVVNESIGKVDWDKFAQQNIQMCYIRATKSTAYEDERFSENKSGSAETELPTGMLHIFDPTMDGKTQAEHFIEVCGSMEGRLRPAVECDPNVMYFVVPLDYGEVSDRLRAFADRIEEEYGCTPVIKCGKRIYEKVVKDERFDDCPVWYESEFTKPAKDVRWDFWGYSSRVRFDYYENKKFLEMVLFDGDEEHFEEMYIR